MAYSFFDQKDVQATGEAFSPQKRTSSTSKNDFLKLFYIFVCIFALLDSDLWTPLNPVTTTLTRYLVV
jgi:hypothetical protein